MAASFYRDMLPRYIVTRLLDPIGYQRLLAGTRERLASAREKLGRNDFGPVRGVGRMLAQQGGIALAEEAPAWDMRPSHVSSVSSCSIALLVSIPNCCDRPRQRRGSLKN